MVFRQKGVRMRGNVLGTDRSSRANTRHLTRILVLLQSYEKLTYTQLHKLTGIHNHLADALRWLENHKLIVRTVSSDSRSVCYCLEKN